MQVVTVRHRGPLKADESSELARRVVLLRCLRYPLPHGLFQPGHFSEGIFLFSRGGHPVVVGLDGSFNPRFHEVVLHLAPPVLE